MDFDNEDMVPTDDTSEVEDKAEDWEYDNLFVGQCVRGLYENGWFNGVVIYYSRLHVFFKKYKFKKHEAQNPEILKNI